MNKTLVAIKCTVYNHEPYLRDCLEGFVMQKTNFRFVAIVHDDASTDGSAAIIREYEEKYPDIIKPIYEIENQYRKLVLPFIKSDKGIFVRPPIVRIKFGYDEEKGHENISTLFELKFFSLYNKYAILCKATLVLPEPAIPWTIKYLSLTFLIISFCSL